MSIGAGIALFVVGAILAFALNFQVAGVDIKLIGDILMIAGGVIFVLGLIFLIRGRSTRAVTTAVDPNGQQVTSQRVSRTTGDDTIV